MEVNKMTIKNRSEGAETNQTLEAIVNAGKKGIGFTMMAAGLGAMVAAPIIAGIAEGVQSQNGGLTASSYVGHMGLSLLEGYVGQNMLVWGNKLAGVPVSGTSDPVSGKKLTGFEKVLTYEWDDTSFLGTLHRTTQYDSLVGSTVSVVLYVASVIGAGMASR
jgi:hypothetical protein